MNVTDDSNQPPQQSIFGFASPTPQWSQVTPQYMPWGHSPTSPAAPLVTFSAQTQPESQISFAETMSLSQPSTSSFGQRPLMHCKRKHDLEINRPLKQHITEEKMAAHMSKLHISSENFSEMPSADMDDLTTREKRLYVCEEMRRLQTESILPSSLLNRLERPCMAVMLWQPPNKLPESVPPTPSIRRPTIEDENDNNSSTLDLNNMDMDS